MLQLVELTKRCGDVIALDRLSMTVVRRRGAASTGQLKLRNALRGSRAGEQPVSAG